MDEKRSLPIKLTLAVGCIYVAGALWMPERGFWIYDTALKFIQVRSLAEYGDFALAWAGRSLDPRLEFGPIQAGGFALVGDDVHSAYSPVFPLLSAPFYHWFGARGLNALPLFGALLTLQAVWRLGGFVASTRASASHAGTAAVLAVAFATPLWFYSLTFWEHVPAVGLSCWSVWACIRYMQEPDCRRAAFVGALAAVPIYFRPENYLFAVVVLAFAGWSARRRYSEVLVLGASCVAALLPLWAFHIWMFGHPLGLHIANQGWADATFADYLTERAQVVVRLLINLHGNQFWSLAAAIPFYLALVMARRIRGHSLQWVLPIAAWAGVASGVVILFGHLTSPRPMNWLMLSNGLFSASPLLILAFINSDEHVAAEVKLVRRTLLGISVAFSVLYALFIPEVNSKGIHWGCRFLLCVYPLLAVLAAGSVVEWWGRIRPGRISLASVTVLVLMSVGFQLYSLALLHDRKEFTAAVNDRVRASNADIIVTDLWFVPVQLVDVFFEKPVFFVSNDKRSTILERAEASGAQSALIVSEALWTQAPGRSVKLSDGWLGFTPLSLTQIFLFGRESDGAALP